MAGADAEAGQAHIFRRRTDMTPISSMKKAKFAIAFLLLALCPATIHAQCTRSCGFGGFSTSVTVTPTKAREGQPVSITIGVFSYYSSPQVFKATVNITPSNTICAAFADAFTVSGTIYPHQNRIFTYTLPAPECASTYNVALNGYVRVMFTVVK